MGYDNDDQPKHNPEEVRALLARLSQDKRAVSAHLAIRVDLERTNARETSRANAAKTTYIAQNDER